jgi:hypothetical protein
MYLFASCNKKTWSSFLSIMLCVVSWYFPGDKFLFSGVQIHHDRMVAHMGDKACLYKLWHRCIIHSKYPNSFLWWLEYLWCDWDELEGVSNLFVVVDEW